MSEARIAPIVEGHGEVAAVRILLERIWRELLGGSYLEVLRPIRRPRSELVREEDLLRAVDLAALKLESLPAGRNELILVFLDAEPDLPCELAPRLMEAVSRNRPHLRVACVLANREYETWFVAAAPALEKFIKLSPRDRERAAPEADRSGKLWIQKRFRRPKYSETIDQPKMTQVMDLHLCRRHSPSFDKLCRELERCKGF